MLLKTAILFTVFLTGYTCQNYKLFSTDYWEYCAECGRQNISLVCGTNNFTYINTCYVDCHNTQRQGKTEIAIAYYSKCQRDELMAPNQPVEKTEGVAECSECWEDDGFEYEVCGSDFITYDNMCIFDCITNIQNEQGVDLYMLNNGICSVLSCGYDRYDPFTEIKTNPTWYNVTSCERQIRVTHYCPECREENPDWDPYCGSDNYTYGNECYLKCAVRQYNEQGKPGPRISHSGSCDPAWNSYFTFFKNAAKTFQGLDRSCSMGDITAVGVEGSKIWRADNTACNDCSTYWGPVCGSDSLSYMNLCTLECVKEHGNKAGLKKAHDGSCDPALDKYLDYFWYVSKTLSGKYKPVHINLTAAFGSE